MRRRRGEEDLVEEEGALIRWFLSSLPLPFWLFLFCEREERSTGAAFAKVGSSRVAIRPRKAAFSFASCFRGLQKKFRYVEITSWLSKPHLCIFSCPEMVARREGDRIDNAGRLEFTKLLSSNLNFVSLPTPIFRVLLSPPAP